MVRGVVGWEFCWILFVAATAFLLQEEDVFLDNRIISQHGQGPFRAGAHVGSEIARHGHGHEPDGDGAGFRFLRHRCENLFSDFLIQIQSRDFPLEESCPRKPKSLAQ